MLLCDPHALCVPPPVWLYLSSLWSLLWHKSCFSKPSRCVQLNGFLKLKLHPKVVEIQAWFPQVLHVEWVGQLFPPLPLQRISLILLLSAPVDKSHTIIHLTSSTVPERWERNTRKNRMSASACKVLGVRWETVKNVHGCWEEHLFKKE